MPPYHHPLCGLRAERLNKPEKADSGNESLRSVRKPDRRSGYEVIRPAGMPEANRRRSMAINRGYVALNGYERTARERWHACPRQVG